MFSLLVYLITPYLFILFQRFITFSQCVVVAELEPVGVNCELFLERNTQLDAGCREIGRGEMRQ